MARSRVIYQSTLFCALGLIVGTGLMPLLAATPAEAHHKVVLTGDTTNVQAVLWKGGLDGHHRERRSPFATALMFVASPSPRQSPALESTLVTTIRTDEVNTVTVEPETSFHTRKLGHVLLGTFPGQPLADSAGEAVRKKFNIQDPALRVRDNFVHGMDRAFGISIRVVDQVLDDDDSKKMRQAVEKGFVIEIRTRIWGTIYYGGDTKHHQIEYWVRSRLLRMDDSKTLWNHTCKFLTKAPKGSRPTAEEMFANDGVMLKEMLTEAADKCSGELFAKFSGQSLR